MRAFIAERWVTRETPYWLSEGGDEALDTVPRIEPTGKDQDDMLTALAWLHAVRDGVPDAHARAHRASAPRRMSDGERVLRLRGQTPALTWRAIGALMNLSHEGARQLYEAAVEAVTGAANGNVTAPVAAVRARLEAVREANRRHKRGCEWATEAHEK